MSYINIKYPIGSKVELFGIKLVVEVEPETRDCQGCILIGYQCSYTDCRGVIFNLDETDNSIGEEPVITVDK